MQRSTVLTVATVVLLVFAPGVAAGALGDGEIPGRPAVESTAGEAALQQEDNVTGHPGLTASVSDNRVEPGEETSLEVVLINDGNVTNGSLSQPGLEDRVTTARALTARLNVSEGQEERIDPRTLEVERPARPPAPLTVETDERAVATLPDGGSATLPFRITVDGDADPGSYPLPLNVSYNYTREVDPDTSEYNRTTASRTFNLTLVVEETARFEVVDVASNARVGATGSVNVTLANTGHEVARNASVSLTSRNTDLTFGESTSASRHVGGSWDPGERRTVSYRVRSARSASQQRYAFDAQVTYENGEGNTRQSRSLSLGVVPDREQTFSVVVVDNSVAVGDEGTVTVRLRNDGPIPVDDASVTLQSSSSDVVFGESATASSYVGRWAPGETRVVAVNATAVSDAMVRNYTVTATVDYEDHEDDAGQSRQLQFGLRPAPEREYEFTEGDVSGNLRVGEDGTLSGTVANTGDRVASNVVVVFETESETLSVSEREAPVGTLDPGESATFAFDVEVSSSAEAGPRQFTLRPQYRNDDDEQRQAESFDVRVDVRPERDVFDVAVADATVPRAGSAVLEVDVANAGNETLTDISAQLFADSPVSVGDDESFVGRLDPGEETTVRFEISASSAALVKVYPVEMDFQYDEDGETELSDTYRVPVSVTEPEESGGPPLVAVVAVVVLAVVVGVAAYRRYA